MSAQGKVVITCAITGAIQTPMMTRHLPIAPADCAGRLRRTGTPPKPRLIKAIAAGFGPDRVLGASRTRQWAPSTARIGARLRHIGLRQGGQQPKISSTFR